MMECPIVVAKRFFSEERSSAVHKAPHVFRADCSSAADPDMHKKAVLTCAVRTAFNSAEFF
jgi:hypothetical protein